MPMDLCRQRAVLFQLVVAMFRVKMAEDDPVNQVTEETIRDEFSVLARSTMFPISDEETRELARSIWEELTAKELMRTFSGRRAGA